MIIAASNASSIIMIVVLLVLFAGMMAISVIPQRKKQREYTEMQNQIKVGTRIMTIGRLVGTVTAINTDNTVEVDIGAKGSPVIIVINREGIGLNLDVPQPVQAGKNSTSAAPQGDVDAEVKADESAEEKEIEAKSDDDKKDDAI